MKRPFWHFLKCQTSLILISLHPRSTAFRSAPGSLEGTLLGHVRAAMRFFQEGFGHFLFHAGVAEREREFALVTWVARDSRVGEVVECLQGLLQSNECLDLQGWHDFRMFYGVLLPLASWMWSWCIGSALLAQPQDEVWQRWCIHRRRHFWVWVVRRAPTCWGTVWGLDCFWCLGPSCTPTGSGDGSLVAGEDRVSHGGMGPLYSWLSDLLNLWGKEVS